MTRRNIKVLAAAATALALGLTACSGGSGDAASSGSAGSDGATDGEKVNLTFATWLPTQEQWPDLVAAFEKENPNISIDFQRDEDFEAFKTNLDNLILAEEVPDIYGIQVGAAFDDYAQYAMPVKDYASEWIDKVNDTARKQTTTTKGEEMAVPTLLAGMEYYLYNKTLMDEHNIKLPTNYDELVAASKAAKDAGLTPFAMGAKDTWHDADFFVWLSNQFGEGDIYKAAAGEIPWDSESLVQAGEAWKKLFTDGVFQEGALTTDTYPQARDDYFMARKSIAMPTGSWHVGAALSNSPEVPGTAIEKDDIGMAVFPTVGPKDAGVTSGVDFAMALSADLDDTKKEAAAKFVEFMTVGEGQQMWIDLMQGFPVANDLSIKVGDSEKDLAKESVKLVEESLASAKYDRKLAVEGKDSLETDLGVVLQNIAGGADVKTELATLK